MATDATSGAPPLDAFNLERFVEAQRGTYEAACRELAIGRKTTHWMWFVFPQLRGLGVSGQSDFYGIGGLAEAQAYLVHPVLGPRLRRVAALLLAIENRSIDDILDGPDDLKLCSSMTLFARAAAEMAQDNTVFLAVLERFFDGDHDVATLQMLELD